MVPQDLRSTPEKAPLDSQEAQSYEAPPPPPYIESSTVPTIYHVYFHPTLKGKHLSTGIIMQSIQRSEATHNTGSFYISDQDSYVYSVLPPKEAKSSFPYFRPKKMHERYFIRGAHASDDEMKGDFDRVAHERIIAKGELTSSFGGDFLLSFREGSIAPIHLTNSSQPSFNYRNIKFQIKRTKTIIDPAVLEQNDEPRSETPNKIGFRNSHFKFSAMIAADHRGIGVDDRGLTILTYTDCLKGVFNWHEKKVGRLNFDEEACFRVFGPTWRVEWDYRRAAVCRG